MSLTDAYIIGSSNHSAWSQGFDPEAYLKVLPKHENKLVYRSPWLEWQQGNKNYRDGIYSEKGPGGSYYSSWGPESDTLDIELRLSDLNELSIPGLGVLKRSTADNGTSYDDGFQTYNGMIPGPLLVVDPGDTLKIRLVNDLENRSGLDLAADTNFHTHGLHVSPKGPGDNVLFSLSPGEAWETEIHIPDNHFVGPQWYHPHLHGATNLQVSNGLAGTLLVLASEDEADDLGKFSPVDNSFYWMAVQTQSLLQQERPASEIDPLNQDIAGGSYRIGTPPLYTEVDGVKHYTKSDAGYIGYNFKPDYYFSTAPSGGGGPAGDSFGYGGGIAGTPTENIIHTVNGQYNPTIDVETGEWNVFGFLNQSVNSHFVIQLIREHEGELSLEDFQVIAVDGDAAGVVSQALQFVTETPVMAPGNRMTIQQAFTKPGTYYFLTNGTEEILGELAPTVANTNLINQFGVPTQFEGIHDGHLIWGSQVLATVEVNGDTLDALPQAPEPIEYLMKESQKIDEWVAETKEAIGQGTIKQRDFEWNANYGRVAASNPDDNDPSEFEGMYLINNRWFGHSPGEQTVVVMPMLGTTEEWTVENSSVGYGAAWGEWHPFHIHQNDFVVTEINGFDVEDIPTYPANQLVDTVTLAGAYVPGTPTPDNPYGTPAYYNPMTGNIDGGLVNFETKFFMKFEDYTGAYVNHCHILFHEDAGMMQAVKIILNTDSNYVGSEQQDSSPSFRIGNSLLENFSIKAFEDEIKKTNIAIGDISYGKYFEKSNLQETFKGGTKGATDNIADIAIVPNRVQKNSSGFEVKLYDGDSVNQAVTGNYKLKKDQEKDSQSELSGDENLLATIKAFSKKKSRSVKSSIAIGDIDGDGHGDIIIGVGGEDSHPMIEIYSGQNYERIAKIKPLRKYNSNTTINIASGDINSDNFADILVGQGAGGMGMVEVYDGRSISSVIHNDEGDNIDANKTQGVNPFKGKKVAKATEAYSEMFHPYAGYTGEVDVATGYILPRPTAAEDSGQIVQTSYANFTTLAVDMKSSEDNPSIRSFFYTGGSAHAHHGEAGHSSSRSSEGSLPSLAVSLNVEKKLSRINSTFFDLSNNLDDRGMSGLVATTKKGKEYLHYIEPTTIEQGEYSIMDTVSINITPDQNEWSQTTSSIVDETTV